MTSAEMQAKATKMAKELGYNNSDPEYPAVQQACLAYLAGYGSRPANKEKAQERAINRAAQPWGSV